MLLHLDDEVTAVRTFYNKGVVDSWQHFLSVQTLSIEIHIDNRTNNLGNVSSNL